MLAPPGQPATPPPWTAWSNGDLRAAKMLLADDDPAYQPAAARTPPRSDELMAWLAEPVESFR